MKLLSLNGTWNMRRTEDGELLTSTVPGSVADTLLFHGKMDDPYWRDNENKVLPLFNSDYIFERSFSIESTYLNHRHIYLRCDGLDTLAEITVNNHIIGKADNMHRTWRFDVKDVLHEGENSLSILFHAPAPYLKSHPSPVGKPYSVMRKAACMFGWDWGINLPDSGIWRDIVLEAFDGGRLDGIIFSQQHNNECVCLKVNPVCSYYQPGFRARVILKAPDGSVMDNKEANAGEPVEFCIVNPELWWPIGYGSQPLYQVETTLLYNAVPCDTLNRRIGLRTINLDRTKLEGGSRYSFVVNGVPIFFRGENLIIEDSILSRSTPERWRALIKNCVRSNLNGIRVWGGAYYPPDIFYDLCDEAGFLVYQDLMFACSFYGVSQDFLANVKEELNDNLARLAYHSCIALFCGNNEIDGVYTVAGSIDPETVELRRLFGAGKDPVPLPIRQALWAQYKPLFLQLIPKQCAYWAPDTSYVHSSPSVPEPGGAKSFFDYLSDGDMHYYLQYNGNAPYQKMRKLRCRFMTEMGFQSYPSMKTICSFTAQEDRLPYTPVMYAHQKCASGNEAIELYMGRDYKVPRAFEDYVYISQLQAGEIMRYSVEHFRRDNSYCRGVVLWQLNDCWPVVSWSGIDYYGRWKALQYYIRRFFSPVLLSVCDERRCVELWLTNETSSGCSGMLHWRLEGANGEALDAGSSVAYIKSGESHSFVKLDYSDILTSENERKAYLRYWFDSETLKSDGTVLFVLPKDFAFHMPSISVSVCDCGYAYAIKVSVDCFTKGIALDTEQGDCIFSDNFFDLSAGESRTIMVEKEDCKGIDDAVMLQRVMSVRTLNEIMLSSEEEKQ